MCSKQGMDPPTCWLQGFFLSWGNKDQRFQDWKNWAAGFELYSTGEVQCQGMTASKKNYIIDGALTSLEYVPLVIESGRTSCSIREDF